MINDMIRYYILLILLTVGFIVGIFIQPQMKTETSSIQVKEIIVRKGVDSLETQQRIYDYLERKYSPRKRRWIIPVLIIITVLIGLSLIAYKYYNR